MKMIPLLLVGDIRAALAFYTEMLDFDLWQGNSPDDPIVCLYRGDCELMLTSWPTNQAANVNALMVVDNVDQLFAFWTDRGLDQSHRTESPVHLGPVDQSWGTREFYVTDPFGNTLRIVQR